LPRQQGDLRVRRTRTLLRSALVELIEERGLDHVTVGQLTERAMVSRAAFYRNFRDKYQLVEQIFDEAISELVGAVADDESPLEERWVRFFDHIAEYERLYGALLGQSGSPWFVNRMRATLAEMAKQHLPDGPGPATDLVPGVLASMFVQTITWWLENDRPSSPRQIADDYGRLAYAVIAEANSWSPRRQRR
jgi:AcrR family transcriptional regulator